MPSQRPSGIYWARSSRLKPRHAQTPSLHYDHRYSPGPLHMEVISLAPHLSVIVGNNQGRFPSAHAFLVQDSVTALIDSGCGIGTLHSIREQYAIDILINSHCHPDHSAGNWVFANCPLYVPSEGVESHGRLEPLSHRLAEPGPLAAQWRRFVTTTMGFREKAPTHIYEDGHEFDFGKLRLRAFHAPGHTIDHYCFFEPELKILLSFDIDLTAFGPWYGHRESDLKQLRHSIKRLRELGPRMVASSHREVVTRHIDEEFDRYEGVLEQREQHICSLLKDGASLEELVRASPIYGHYPYEPDLLRYWEAQTIQKHLEDMVVKNIVRRNGERYFPIL
jgi:glyoxylase-like metal-dependent hydrolase (beta-lactamase superfamily II)